MNNYYGQHEDQYNSQGLYTNTYNLWQNSQYYDTNNLSLRNYLANKWKESKNDVQQTKSSISTENQSSAVLNRETLYKDPQLFSYNDHKSKTFLNSTQNDSLFGWPQQNWVKAGESSNELEQGLGDYTRHTYSNNKIEKRLNKALKNPVKMTKAESMMQKMGWQGGALGKTGDGILLPIAPNAVYATTTAGFGHCYQLEKQKQRKQQQYKQNSEHNISESKKHFYTNTLESILTFVRNDFELEMLFDKTLLKGDRKRIHILVNEVIASDSPEDAMYADEVQTNLLRQIQHYNCYVLSTQSQGEASNRVLTLYKEAPAHVFLIIPDDLRDDEIEDETSDVDIDESNPFLKSITKNIKENKMNKQMETHEIERTRTCLNKIIDYFGEFQLNGQFTELRFLGPFNGDEIEAINKFLNDMNKCIDNFYSDVSEDLVKLFKRGSSSFKINPDVNGSAVVHKVKEEQKKRIG